MSKITKLITKPGLFFRDYLIKKHPITMLHRASQPIESYVHGAKVQFPIDLVYTWVDSNDIEFKKTIAKYKESSVEVDDSAVSEARWKNHDELKYSLRSIEKYAPWINSIYIVTNGQVPSWLKVGGRLKVITHEQILDKKYLPTFNSHVIGSALHHIPGLSERYIYFNDDIFLLNKVGPDDYFLPNGLAHAFISSNELDNGPPSIYDIPTVVAAKNSRKLINDRFEMYFSRRMAHMYHPQLKSVAKECETMFADQYDQFRTNRFRANNDLLCASFLHPYVGYILGKFLFKTVKGHYVKIREKGSLSKYENIIARNNRNVLCANDYIPPGFDFHDYQEHFINFLERLYPHKSQFELNAELKVEVKNEVNALAEIEIENKTEMEVA